VVLWTWIWAHSYQIKVVDAAGNNSLTHSFTYQVEANDTTAPTIEYTPIANQFNVSAVPASIIFTIGDDVLVTTLTLQHWGVPTSVFSALSGWTYTLALANTVWLHEYTLTAWDAVGNTTSKTVTYNVVADTVTNINISGFTVSNLGSTWVTVAWTTSETSADSKVDFYANGSQLLNQTATVSGSVNSLTVSTLLANKSYTVIIKSRVTWQTNYTTLSFIINTAASANGIVVHSVERILDGSTPTAGGGYASGYHFRFQVTINNLSKSSVSFKLADWSNSVATMAVASNTKFVWSADGVDSHTEGTILGSLSAADTYASANNVSTVDGDSGVWWRQLVLDMFYQIPTGAQWVFSTSYGIKAE